MPRKTDLTPDMQAEIVECLSLGMTIEATCDFVGISAPTYYAWVKRGERGWKNDELFVEFFNAITQAKARAYRSAVIAVKTGMIESKSVTTETFTETRTRLNKQGEVTPYDYSRTVKKETRTPADWRAGIEYLKRRDPANWSATLTVNINIALVQRTVKALEDAGYDTEVVFNDLIRAAEQRKLAVSQPSVEAADADIDS